MATQTLVERVDDLDESPDAKTVTFGLDGSLYDIDLNDGHALEFRLTVGKYAAVARPVRQKRTTANRERGAQIRSWAKKNGYKVGKNGRIPVEIEDAFTAALRNTRTLI